MAEVTFDGEYQGSNKRGGGGGGGRKGDSDEIRRLNRELRERLRASNEAYRKGATYSGPGSPNGIMGNGMAGLVGKFNGLTGAAGAVIAAFSKMVDMINKGTAATAGAGKSIGDDRLLVAQTSQATGMNEQFLFDMLRNGNSNPEGMRKLMQLSRSEANRNRPFTEMQFTKTANVIRNGGDASDALYYAENRLFPMIDRKFGSEMSGRMNDPESAIRARVNTRLNFAEEQRLNGENDPYGARSRFAESQQQANRIVSPIFGATPMADLTAWDQNMGAENVQWMKAIQEQSGYTPPTGGTSTSPTVPPTGISMQSQRGNTIIIQAGSVQVNSQGRRPDPVPRE